MWYNKFVMDMTYKNNNLILTQVADFRLCDIFDCGQCFRWNKQEDGSYIGVALGRALKITQTDEAVVLYDTTPDDFEKFWFNYFDLDRDYAKIREKLSFDEKLSGAFEFGSGIRLLRQQLWECVVSFIISASNNIPRIKKIVELFCRNFGDEITYMGEVYYTFPTPEKTAALTLEELQVIRAGFRDKYILDAAEKFLSDPQMSFEYLNSASSSEAKNVLMRINGVGSKVADCVLLFGLGKYDCFPIDVWMKRIMEYCYFGQAPQDVKTIAAFAAEHFKELGGFAQQYLFFYARENKIGI